MPRSSPAAPPRALLLCPDPDPGAAAAGQVSALVGRETVAMRGVADAVAAVLAVPDLAVADCLEVRPGVFVLQRVVRRLRPAPEVAARAD